MPELKIKDQNPHCSKHVLANRLLTLKKMREIKFRVFDKKIGKIFKAHDLRFIAEEAIYEVCPACCSCKIINLK